MSGRLENLEFIVHSLGFRVVFYLCLGLVIWGVFVSLFVGLLFEVFYFCNYIFHEKNMAYCSWYCRCSMNFCSREV